MSTSTRGDRPIDVRRAGDRFHTKIDWLDSRHSFSFGHHYDPANTHHGLLLVSQRRRRPRRHRLQHASAPGHGDRHLGARRRARAQGLPRQPRGDLPRPGTAHERGHRHLALGDEPSPRPDVHFVQMWVPPDTERIDPGYEQLDINAELDKGGLVPIASGQGHDAAISIRQRGAVLWGGRLKAGEAVACRTPRRPPLRGARRRRRSRAPARWPRATPSASPGPAPRADGGRERAPRSSSGRPREPSRSRQEVVDDPEHEPSGMRSSPGGARSWRRGRCSRPYSWSPRRRGAPPRPRTSRPFAMRGPRGR